ncbi:GNAT family N-acetyltransferase [Pseudidiomarina sediminum]|uniref:GNAT family N-acetyltransferase n=1 Tax=Pseudidiomarina sediminum TaxID=431675 RepID=A0A432Z469_9GAMM|nr:N-acetyltransferase [Pseudidiomarina sediminum]RUO72677.1 GNAT family N-acetyltransferase [Pseudidiomarina sediminum]
MTLRFRTASTADVAVLASLEASFYPDDGYPAPVFFQAIHQWPELLYVAEVEAQVVGYCMGAPGTQAGQIWLMSLLVGASQRGQGVGAKLLQTWLHEVQQLGYHNAWLSVSPANPKAAALYQKHGFNIVAEEQDYLGPGEDRYIMQRNALTHA